MNDPCAIILQNGLYKHFEIQKSKSFNQDIKSYFESAKFTQDFKSGKWGFDIGVVVKGVPINLGINASDNEIHKFQEQIRQSNSFSLSESNYEYIKISVPDPEIAEKYNECRSLTKSGFKVIAETGDSVVTFIVNYLPEISTDPMPKVTHFEIRNGTNISGELKIGESLKNQEVITTSRDSNKDLHFVLETSRGSITKTVYADSPGYTSDLPIGTVIASFLNWASFSLATQNNKKSNGIFNTKYSKWAPCDGRDVVSSKFANYFGDKVPDLRGVFLRGLNSIDDQQRGQKDLEARQKDPDNDFQGNPRRAGSFQSESFTAHTHTLGVGGGDSLTMATGNHPWNTGRLASFHSDQFNKAESIRNTNSTGGGETRPKNIAVYYYIRIN